MTIVIVSLAIIAYVLIAGEYFTKINKTTIAIFTGVVAWILYLTIDDDYQLTAATQAFSGHVEYIGGIVLYLLTTMNIVDVLSNNGCFNFVKDMVRSRSTNRLLWGLVGITFLISANFDNLTTAVLMLGVMHNLLQNSSQRRFVGAAIVIAACCGGCITVIGDVTSLMVWTRNAVTPSSFSFAMLAPALAGVAVPTLLIRRSLPDHLDLKSNRYNYYSDDSAMPIWQRTVMVIIGFVGLWFVPSFHRITLLPPFLGSLCVLSVLWMLTEIFNRKSIQAESPMMIPGTNRRLHNEVIQMIMYFMGVALAVSVLKEIGVLEACGRWIDTYIHDVYLFSGFIGLISALLDNICLVFSAINIYDVLPAGTAATAYQSLFLQNGQYWHLVIISGCLGGCLLPIGNVTGDTLMKAEDASLRWYVRHISGKALAGWIAAMFTYFLVQYFVI